MAKQDRDEVFVSQRAITQSLLITLASAFFWSYLICSISFSNSSYTQGFFDFSSSVNTFCGLIAFILTQLVLRKAPGIYRKERMTLTVIISLILALPSLLVLILQPFDIGLPYFILPAIWFCWGLSAGLFFPLVGSAWSVVEKSLHSRKTSPRLVCVVFMGVACLIVLIILIPVQFQRILTVLTCLLAYGLFFVFIRDNPGIKEKGSEPFLDEFNPAASPKKITPFIICTTASITVGFSLFTLGILNTLAVSAGASLVAGLLILVVIHFARFPLLTARIERFLFPTASICFLLLVILPASLLFLSLFLLMTLFVLYVLSHWSFLVASSHRFAFSSPYHFSLGLIMPAVGLVVGWVIISLYAFIGRQYFGSSLLFFCCVIFYIVVISIAPFSSDPTLEIDLLDPDITESMDEQKKGQWKQRCELICSEANLSPREREVFDLLARGRNAEYIQAKLFISRNTVNTHKYRIYQKLNIDSQQKLLDLVDNKQMVEDQ